MKGCSWIGEPLRNEIAWLGKNPKKAIEDLKKKKSKKPKFKRLFPNYFNALEMTLEILFDPAFKQMWAEATNKYSWHGDIDIEARFQFKDGQLWLFSIILDSFPSKRWESKEEDEWKNKIKKALNDVYLLLEDPPPTYPLYWTGLIEKYQDEYCENLAAVLPSADADADAVKKAEELKKLSSDYLLFKNIANPRLYLEHLFDQIEHYKARHFWGARRGGNIGERAYFVRSLTFGFLARLGKPCRSEVQNITDRIFESDKGISKTQLINLTKIFETDEVRYTLPHSHSNVFFGHSKAMNLL